MNRWKIRPLIWLKRQPEQRVMMILAVVVGLGSGAAAVVLKTLIELIGKLLTGWFDASWDNFLLLLYPGAGMLLSPPVRVCFFPCFSCVMWSGTISDTG